jgi:7-cyano-7-deazaguanine synthase
MTSTETKPRALVLLSGGIDSAACAHFLTNDFSVECLFVDYGQAACDLEREASQRVANMLGVELCEATARTNRSFATGEVPGRNGLLALLALAASGYGANVIAMGLHAGTPYYDCSPAFADRFDIILREYSLGRVRFFSPFLNWSKHEVYEYFRNASLDLSVTYSCEAGTSPPCGKCLSCLDRAQFDAGQKT